MKLTAEKLAEQKGMLSIGEVKLLKKCAAMLPENPVVIIIGAGVGTSALAILEARPDTFIFSIDKKPRSEEREALVAGAVDFTRCLRVLSDSALAGRHFPFHVDAVFVDGAHDNRAVAADIDMWLPSILDGGIMLFHDVNHPNLPGLTPLIHRKMSEYEIIGENRYLIAYKIRHTYDLGS